ncbi:MAG: hypothetical protein J3Q66DRAFT_400035 [Benniella sp.]|nr:MAG: hypothetical protein J3Q66DRAFT_400035 [Benniella sp.]
MSDIWLWAQKDLTDISFHRAAMDIKAKDVGPNEVIKVIEPTSTESTTRIPVLWHPSSEFLLSGRTKTHMEKVVHLPDWDFTGIIRQGSLRF